MAWGRLALLHAADEGETALQTTADLFGFELEEPVPKPKLEKEENGLNLFGGKNFYVPTKLPPQPKRPPAVFFRVNYLETLTEENTTEPDYLNDPAKCLGSNQQTGRSYSFAAPNPMLPMARLLPFLHNALGQPKAVNRLDHRRLTRHLAQGKPLHSLPRKVRHRWPQRLQIIVDAGMHLESYWADFAFIVDQLKKLLGEEAVSAIRFDEDTFDSQQPYVIPWPSGERERWQPWHAPGEDTALLILSDLGISDTQSAKRIRWQRFLERLSSNGERVLTLSPASKAPLDRAYCRLARPNPLNDRFNLPRHPKHNGFTMGEPEQQHLDGILALLSALPLIDAGLLRRLRLGLSWGGSELESLIWNHPDIRQTGLGIRLHDTVAERYRKLYQEQFAGSSQAQLLWQIVEAHHSNAFEGLQKLEALNKYLLETASGNQGQIVNGTQKQQLEQELTDYFQSLCASANQSMDLPAQHQALMLQCRTVLASRPETIWRSGVSKVAYDLYAMAYKDQIRAGEWPDKLEPGFDPTRLEWLVDERAKTERVQWQVEQTGGQGELLCRIVDEAAPNPQALATINAHWAFPPRWTAADSSDETFLNDGQAFDLPSGKLTLRSTLQQLELEAFSKPSWATAIEYNQRGLLAGITWLGQTVIVPWHPLYRKGMGSWLWPGPFGWDEFGLYADLAIKKVNQRFRWIEPGTFLMGSPESEPEHDKDEIQHGVTLTQGYWLADTACSQALWQAVMGKNPAVFQEDPSNPVEHVSWNDTQAFIGELNKLFPG
ncbi:MAG: hypothetical protein CTY29_12825, partial [Methylobacter sp.]